MQMSSLLKRQQLVKRLRLGVAIAVGMSAVTFGMAVPVYALSWQTTLDHSNDSFAAEGGDHYELYKGGFAQDSDYAYFAFDTNLAITGRTTGPTVAGYDVPDRNIGWGDFFLDFNQSSSFRGALDSNSMMAVKMSPNNDSLVVEQGLYGNVSGYGVQGTNAGSWDIEFTERRSGQKQWLGETDPSNSSYYNSIYDVTSFENRAPNVIGSGDYVDSITTLDASELDLLGFSTIGRGSFGFKVAKDSLPLGQFVGTLLAECLNEGFSISGEITHDSGGDQTPDPVPTPAVVLPIVSGLFAAAKRKQNQGEFA